MSITTYAEFVNQIVVLPLTGLTRRYNEPPHQVNTADLPCGFPMIPSGEERTAITAQASGGWPRMTLEYVILVEPVLQNVNSVNFAAAVGLMDSVSGELRIAPIGRAPLRWDVRLDRMWVGSVLYWNVVFRITAEG